MTLHETKKSQSYSMLHTLLIIVVIYLLGTILQHIIATDMSKYQERTWAVLTAIVVFAFTLAAGTYRKYFTYLSSNKFSAPTIMVVALFSLLGTIILQNPPQHVVRQSYGSVLPLINAFYLTDIFHSYGFLSIIGLMSGGLGLTIFRKRSMTVRYVGSVIAHVGILVILAGAAVGNIWGVNGFLQMHVGQSYDSFLATSLAEKPVPHQLDFIVRLDDFHLEHYKSDYQVMVFDISGKKEKKLVSVAPRQESNSELEPYGIAITHYWPDFYQKTQVTAQEHVLPSAPLSGLLLAQASQDSELWLLDKHDGQGDVVMTPDNKRLAFYWSEKQAQAAFSSDNQKHKNRMHILEIKGHPISVGVNETVAIPDSQLSLQITKFFTDFVIDGATKQPTNRSDNPNNPAVEVEIKNAENKVLKRTWLFAKFPNFQHEDGDVGIPNIVYRYGENTQQIIPDILLIGESKQLLIVENKKIVAKFAYTIGDRLPKPWDAISVAQLHEQVTTQKMFATKSDQPDNPVLEIAMSHQEQPIRIVPQQPIRLSETQVAVLSPQGGDTISDYLSTLSVFEGNQKVLTKTIEVNDPLTYNGYTFYQSDFRREDPTFSGLQVHKDPGMWLVYLGLFINMIGVMLSIFIPPFLKRRKQKSLVTEHAPQ